MYIGDRVVQLKAGRDAFVYKVFGNFERRQKDGWCQFKKINEYTAFLVFNRRFLGRGITPCVK